MTPNDRDEPQPSSFNGAALLRARKRSAKPPTKPTLPGFNGAALLRARKHATKRVRTATTFRLQRGRAFEGAETRAPS